MSTRLPIILFALLCIYLNRAAAKDPKHFTKQQSDYFGFVENKGQLTDQFGQSRPDIDFRLSAGELTVFIGRGQLHYQWSRQHESADAKQKFNGSILSNVQNTINIYRLDVQLLNSSNSGNLQKEGRHSYIEHYYLPQCGTDGATAKSYLKIVYKDIYPNIDWVLYIKQGKLEQDFVVHPNGKVSDIQMQFKGATDITLNDNGSFTATTPFGAITESAPNSFYDGSHKVSSAYVLTGNLLGFTTGAYKGTLTIDPTVSWSTYIGGNGFADIVEDIELNDFNALYVAGQTLSGTNIATIGSHQVIIGGGSDGFLKKYDRSGAVIWATYYGGENDDVIRSVACDSIGNVYVAGNTMSIYGIATPGSHQPVLGGFSDVFFAKFDSTGTRIFGSYYGGNDDEGSHAKIAVKGSSLFVGGATMSSSGIATAGAHQSVLGGSMDAFVAKFTLAGSREWGTYYGGLGADGFANSLACDTKGNIYLFGTTSSDTGIATAGAHKSAYSFITSNVDHFLAKFNKNGIRQWGTYYGGPDEEFGHFSSRNIVCDRLGNVYMAGATSSTSGISTSGSHQTTFSGETDNYLSKFDSNGVRQWATYYGGTEAEMFPSVHIADSNRIYLNGTSASPTGIATANALQVMFAGGAAYGDAFIADFNENGIRQYGTYFGGPGIDGGLALTTDKDGYIYLGGCTNSTSGIATAGSNQSTYPGGMLFNGFLARLCHVPSSTLPISGNDSVCHGSINQYSVPAVADATS